MDCSLPGSRPWDSPAKNSGVDCHFLFRGIFPTQGWNPGLLHFRQNLYHWATREGRTQQKSNPNSKRKTIYFFNKYYIELGIVPLEIKDRHDPKCTAYIINDDLSVSFEVAIPWSLRKERGREWHTSREGFSHPGAGRTAHAHTEPNKLLDDAESAGPLALEVIQFRISFPRGKPRWNESLKVSSFRISWLWSPGIYSASPFCVPHSSPSPPLIARMSLCPAAPEGRGSVRWEAPELPSPAQPDAKTCGLALPQPGTPLAGFESSAGSARPLLKKGGRRNPREGLSPRCRLPWQPVPPPAPPRGHPTLT